MTLIAEVKLNGQALLQVAAQATTPDNGGPVEYKAQLFEHVGRGRYDARRAATFTHNPAAGALACLQAALEALQEEA